MRIVVTGTRGIPGIQGGVETHCEELFPRIADNECEIIVIRRPKYISHGYDTINYKHVTIKDIKTLPGKHLEAFTHTLFAVFYAKKIKADIIHIHAIGPSLMIPVARALGLKVVMTHHGPDYDRQKWGYFSKIVLKFGERVGILYANHVIVISQHIKNLILQKYPSQKHVTLIHNGVSLTSPLNDHNYIKELGLEKQDYILAVGRFVKEKGFHLLLDAYNELKDRNIKLVIAGDADHEDIYSRMLKSKAHAVKAILTGFIQKEQLSQLYGSTRLFVLPSFHEGLPISLLEAMNCGAEVLVSNIPANLEVGLPEKCYFKCGDTRSLLNQIETRLKGKKKQETYNMSAYNWDYIAEQTKEVYKSLIK
ncbi:glycosyltransferase family 4 protein [Bacteroides sp.]